MVFVVLHFKADGCRMRLPMSKFLNILKRGRSGRFFMLGQFDLNSGSCWVWALFFHIIWVGPTGILWTVWMKLSPLPALKQVGPYIWGDPALIHKLQASNSSISSCCLLAFFQLQIKEPIMSALNPNLFICLCPIILWKRSTTEGGIRQL